MNVTIPRRMFAVAFAGLLAVLTLAAQASAQDAGPAPEGLESSRGLAMGTGVRASAVSTSALAYNPAGLPVGRLYHLEAFAGYVPDVERWEVGGSIVDSMTNKLAAGLSFRGLLGNGEEGYSGIDGRLGLGMPLSDAFSMGVAVRYLSLSRDGQIAEGESDELAQGVTLDASILVQPTEGLRLLAFGYNLIDMDSPYAPVLVGGSGAFTAGEAFTLGADILVDLSTYENVEWTLGGGGEYLAAGQVPLRAGYAYDHGRRVHTATFGIGYVDKKVGIDLSLAQDVRGASETELFLAIRYFVQ